MNVLVGVSDMKVTDNSDSVVITYALGSCIGITVYDPIVRVGGILHFMLPESSLDPGKAEKRPYMFADTGIPALFKAAYKLGAKKQRMRVTMVGGAQVLDQNGFFNIGKRNCLAAKKVFWKNNVVIDYQDVGGNFNRTLRVMIRNGEVWVKTSGHGQKKI